MERLTPWANRAASAGDGPLTNASDRANVLRFGSFASGSHVEGDLLALLERLEPTAGDVGVVDEDVALVIGLGDESEALLAVEELHSSGCHVFPSFLFLCL